MTLPDFGSCIFFYSKMKFHAFYLFPTTRRNIAFWAIVRQCVALFSDNIHIDSRFSRVAKNETNKYAYSVPHYKSLSHVRPFWFLLHTKIYVFYLFQTTLRNMAFWAIARQCVLSFSDRIHIDGWFSGVANNETKKNTCCFFFPENMIVFLLRLTSLENITFSYMNLWILWVYVNRNFHDEHSMPCPRK